MKNCPKCDKAWSEEFLCCPICGVQLILNHECSNVNMGNANAISGGVHTSDDHSNTNSNNETHIGSHNTTNNTTIYEATKSESEKLKENVHTYRLKCQNFFKDGLISNAQDRQLRELQFSLNLSDDIVLPIKEDIRRQSKTRKKQLSITGMSDIRQTKSIIEQNTAPALQRQLVKLESWMQEYDDNTLKLMYYQMSSILEPLRYTNRFEDGSKDEYWEVYWAHVAYLLQNREKQANEALASLGRWHAYYPEQNDIILLIVGQLMRNEPIEDIRHARNQLTAHFTPDLQLLLDAIDELLQMDWAKETICIRPAHSFYINTLFKGFVETQTAIGRQQLIEIREQERLKREEEERKRQAELKLQNQIKCQKASVLQKFQELGQIENACFEVGVPYHTFNLWLEEDAVFASSYNDMIRSVEIKKYEEAEKKRKEEELEIQTKKLKHNFKILFEQNECDLLKTCTEVGISSANYYDWCRNDAVFNDEIAYIIRKNEEIIENERIAKRYETFRKYRPFIFIIIILVFAVGGVISYSSYKEEQVQSEITQSYNNKIREFEETFKLVNSTDQGREALVQAYDIINQLTKLEKSENFVEKVLSIDLETKLNNKVENMIEECNTNIMYPDQQIANDYQNRLDKIIEIKQKQ